MLQRLGLAGRWIGLLAAYLVFGLAVPVLTRYQEQVFARAGGDITSTPPDPTPPRAIAGYVSQVTQLSLLVAIVLAAGALAFDAEPEWAAFLRTRAPVGAIVVPTFVVNAAAVAAAFALGAIGVWYETTALIDDLPAGGMVAGIGFGACTSCSPWPWSR